MRATRLTVYETRRENLKRLLREPGAKTALAVKLDCNQTYITHLLAAPGSRGAREIKEDTARQIESIIGLSPGELDQEPGAARADSGLIEEAVRVVVAAAIDAHAKMAADKTANVVRMVYDNSVIMGRVDPAFAAQLVRLMR